jgi:hypothetical protein
MHVALGNNTPLVHPVQADGVPGKQEEHPLAHVTQALGGLAAFGTVPAAQSVHVEEFVRTYPAEHFVHATEIGAAVVPPVAGTVQVAQLVTPM